MTHIALAGNQWFSVYLLERMIEQGQQPSLLINMPPERAKPIAGYVDLGPIAARHDIALYRPATFSLKAEEDQQALLQQPIDLLIAYGWQRLIPAWLIDHARLGAYGVHGGPEPPPRCRGQAVFNWALLLGCETFHMYLFQLNPEADTGALVDLVQFDVAPHDDIVTLYHKNCVVSSRMILAHLEAMATGKVRLRAQPSGPAGVLPRRRPENGGIQWDESAERIVNLVRAVAPPYPGAFTALDKMVITITAAQVFDTQIPFDAPPGTVVDRFPNGDLLVMASDYPVLVRELSCSEQGRIERGVRLELHSGVPLPDPEL